MPITSAPRREPRSPRVLLVSGSAVVVAVVLLVVVAALALGRPAALGALVGGTIAVSFFLVGSGVVAAAVRLAPQTVLLVALLTYALQVAVVALVFAELVASGALEETLSPAWLAGGVGVATAVWTAAQLLAVSRARIPAYDVDLPGSRRPSPGEPVERGEAGAR